MKGRWMLIGLMALLPMAVVSSDALALKSGNYRVCDDARDPRNPQSIHMKEGDQVTIGAIGAAADVQFDRRVISMVASADRRQLSAVIEFAHDVDGKIQTVKHLVRMVKDAGYTGPKCPSGNVIVVDFCPQAADGSWQCRTLNCEATDSCHAGAVHLEN